MAYLSSNELVKIFDEQMSNCASYQCVSGMSNPMHIVFDETEMFVYIKNLSPAYFSNVDVWRAQMTGVEALKDIKASDKMFVLLGYDAEHDVYAAWNPHHAKQRIDTAASPSFYSRFSWQKQAAETDTFMVKDLKNDGVVLLFPCKLLDIFFKDINIFFPEATVYVAKGSKRLSRMNKADAVKTDGDEKVVCDVQDEEKVDYETPWIDKNGILTRIENPELLKLLKPDLDTEYPSRTSAYATVEDFYGERFPNMQLWHWLRLFNDIDWGKPVDYTARTRKFAPKERHKERKKILITYPDGHQTRHDKVLNTLLEVIEYAGVEEVRKLGIRMGQTGGALLFHTTIDPKYDKAFKKVGEDCYINTCSSTKVKFFQINRINEKMNLGLKVELV